MPRQNEVLVVTPFYTPRGGEVARIAEKLIREIGRQGAFHFTWAACRDRETLSAPTLLPEIEGHSLLPLPAWTFLDCWFRLPIPFATKRSLERLESAMAQAEIVWIHGTDQPISRTAFKIARRLNKQTVVTLHTGRTAKGRFWRRWYDDWMDKHIRLPMLQAADQAVFVSDRVAEDYFRRGRFARAVSVVPNGVDFRVYHPPLAETRRYIRQRFALKAEQPVMLYVGPTIERKGILAIREMAKLLPEWRFWVAGLGPVDPAKWMLPNVHVFRDKSAQTLTELYQGADVLLMPGAGTNFPRAIQEAMACGLPVLCGPGTAEGSRAAMPFIHLAHVWPHDDARTARTWVDYLKDFPLKLPRPEPEEDVANFALQAWDWPPIAEVYASLLNTLRRKAGRS